MGVLGKLMKSQTSLTLPLQEMQAVNLSGAFRQMSSLQNLMTLVGQNEKLFKLKLSKVNLNDAKIVSILCQLICGL